MPVNKIYINIPNITPKKIVEYIKRYENECDVYIKTDKFKYISKNGYVIFKKRNKHKYNYKRVFDLSFGIISFIFSLPIFFLTFILLKLFSKENPFFTQDRVGENMKIFKFYKFTTMNNKENCDIHKNFMENSIKGNFKHQRFYKLINDPRITPIGKWLRRLSIDELPQIINVLKNDMSLVGPRPPVPYEIEIYDEWQKERLRVKPGITGLWQVMGRSLIPFDEMVVLDLYYSKNFSIWMDIKILLRTIPSVLSLRGAF